MKTKKIAAAELMAKLNANPGFVANSARDETERQERDAELRSAEAPIIDELRAAGLPVESVWDLVSAAAAYPAALPILLDHLQRPYPPVVREGIARALAVPASFGWSVLTRLYRNEQEMRVKDALAVAIAAAASDELIDDVIALVRDPSQGRSRVLLLRALERSRDRRARATLMQVGTDPDLARESQLILDRLKSTNGK